MPDTEEALRWVGRRAVDRDGEGLGTIADVLLDNRTGGAAWMVVDAQPPGGGPSVIPVRGAAGDGATVRVPYAKSHVDGAPQVAAAGALSPQEETALLRHFGLAPDDRPVAPVRREPSTAATDDAMTRSEEELRVGTAEHEAGRVRLRKFITTEQVEVSVPLQREELRIEREPITGFEAGAAEPTLSEEEHEIVLHAEEPVVEKHVVATERVRIEKDSVVDRVQVSEQVRKEQIELDGDTGRP